MNNKLSNSAVDKYVECSLCYKLHYIDRIRPIRGKSALLFGGALDTALNNLLLNKDLIKARAVFYDSWKTLKINDIEVDGPSTDLIDYSKSDLDLELVEFNETHGYPQEGRNINWRSLLYKGMLFIETYYKEVLPKIKEVIAIQELVSLKNEDGDEITGFLDLIVKWTDGKTYLLDNKSSSVVYADDSAKTGQQLPLYYYIVKEKYKLDGIGYIVLNKKINKNKVKLCKKCGIINKETHKTCNNIVDGIRCNSGFEITIKPSVDVQYVLNQVAESDEKRVLDKFDEVNYNVSNGYFADTHSEKRNKYFQWCPYKDYTPENPNFIKLPKRSK
jgi:hypothetical protein